MRPDKAPLRRNLIITGLAGLLAACLVGIGEYLLHYDELARFSVSSYDFMLDIPVERSTLGHFVAVFGATLYPVGCYHIYLMLRPANDRVAFLTFLLACFGFIVGVVWIGSRASIAALIQLPESPEITGLIELYVLRYETLLNVIRLTTLILSVVIIWLSLTGKSLYPKWIALFNPIVLLIANFILFMLVPSIGKHTMPIALNVAFFIFFILSLFCAFRTNVNSSKSGPRTPTEVNEVQA